MTFQNLSLDPEALAGVVIVSLSGFFWLRSVFRKLTVPKNSECAPGCVGCSDDVRKSCRLYGLQNHSRTGAAHRPEARDIC